ncbi:MAG: hypothetical protein IJN52_01080 [Bacteroidales bacterium]|nr:hypothetical protein [Bacteroidales bacterium]
MKRFFLFICACFVLIGSAIAQTAEQREYIYCTVDFSDNPNRKCEIFVDFGQHMKKLLPDTVNDKRLMGQFNSEMAAINWMSRNGWELFMYRPHMSEGSSYIRYIMRMDVTGMTEEQINSKLTMFVMPTEGVRPPQNPDGSFPVMKTAEETPTFLNPVPAVEEQ